MSKLNLGTQILGAFYTLSRKKRISIIEAYELEIEEGIKFLEKKGYVQWKRDWDLTEYELTGVWDNFPNGESYRDKLVEKVLEDINSKK